MKFSGWSAFAGGAVCGAVAGGVVSFLLYRHFGEIRLQVQLKERLDEEVCELKQHYQDRLHDATERAQRDALLAFAAAPSADDDGGRGEIVSDVPPTVLSAGGDDGVGAVIRRMVDYGAISSGLKPKAKSLAAPPLDGSSGDVDVVPAVPYVITLEQFCEDKEKYQKLCFTYYMDDHTLADEGDQPVEDPVSTVGPALESKFGLSSPTDPNVVYVRNDRLEIDFEITRHMGSYATIVAGLEYGGLASERSEEQETN
jgi:hypothetical protein